MNKLVKELNEEILEKVFTLLELDNKVQSITGSTSSIFDNSIEDSYTYYIEEDKEITVEWEIVKENENDEEILVKVTSIWEN